MNLTEEVQDPGIENYNRETNGRRRGHAGRAVRTDRQGPAAEMTAPPDARRRFAKKQRRRSAVYAAAHRTLHGRRRLRGTKPEASRPPISNGIAKLRSLGQHGAAVETDTRVSRAERTAREQTREHRVD